MGLVSLEAAVDFEIERGEEIIEFLSCLFGVIGFLETIP